MAIWHIHVIEGSALPKMAFKVLKCCKFERKMASLKRIGVTLNTGNDKQRRTIFIVSFLFSFI